MQLATLAAGFVEALGRLSAISDGYVPSIVTLLIDQARTARASDIHLVPTESALIVQWRIDGVLHPIAGFDRDLAPRIVARLKVISGLLTYRTDVPQEGRVSREFSRTEVRITTFPTLHGEKAAIRLFAENDQLQTLKQLGLPEEVEFELRRHLAATAGVIMLTGPSGSGKTTTAYACLRDIIADSVGTRCIMSLEDPVEVAVDGATQSQVRPAAGFDLATGLRSLMRQDPDVIFVGEIRDPATAEAAFQAALTGHLVLTTFHAGNSAEAITRLLEMQIEPYLIRSGLRTVICQRLLRKICANCRDLVDHTGAILSQSAESERTSDKFVSSPAHRIACAICGSTGYHGRLVLAEMLNPNSPEVAKAILNKLDAPEVARLAIASGMQTMEQRAATAVANGETTYEEVLRVLGSNAQASGVA
ncbi:MAG: type II/IV secretion system protein [Planctomycetota bacterium]|nr:MAG: type II/IV secretion system protein [Planctomycetota bacterium]